MKINIRDYDLEIDMSNTLTITHEDCGFRVTGGEMHPSYRFCVSNYTVYSYGSTSIINKLKLLIRVYGFLFLQGKKK